VLQREDTSRIPEHRAARPLRGVEDRGLPRPTECPRLRLAIELKTKSTRGVFNVGTGLDPAWRDQGVSLPPSAVLSTSSIYRLAARIDRGSRENEGGV